MAERHIGLVKQVIRCLQADRHLPKASWPGLLTKVSFHINGMKNGTSRQSPHILTLDANPTLHLMPGAKISAKARETPVRSTFTP